LLQTFLFSLSAMCVYVHGSGNAIAARFTTQINSKIWVNSTKGSHGGGGGTLCAFPVEKCTPATAATEGTAGHLGNQSFFSTTSISKLNAAAACQAAAVLPWPPQREQTQIGAKDDYETSLPVGTHCSLCRGLAQSRAGNSVSKRQEFPFRSNTSCLCTIWGN
jgi:hypothetical protein